MAGVAWNVPACCMLLLDVCYSLAPMCYTGSLSSCCEMDRSLAARSLCQDRAPARWHLHACRKPNLNCSSCLQSPAHGNQRDCVCFSFCLLLPIICFLPAANALILLAKLPDRPSDAMEAAEPPDAAANETSITIVRIKRRRDEPAAPEISELAFHLGSPFGSIDRWLIRDLHAAPQSLRRPGLAGKSRPGWTRSSLSCRACR